MSLRQRRSRVAFTVIFEWEKKSWQLTLRGVVRRTLYIVRLLVIFESDMYFLHHTRNLLGCVFRVLVGHGSEAAKPSSYCYCYSYSLFYSTTLELNENSPSTSFDLLPDGFSSGYPVLSYRNTRRSTTGIGMREEAVDLEALELNCSHGR